MEKYFFEYDEEGNILSTTYFNSSVIPAQERQAGKSVMEVEVKEWMPQVQRDHFTAAKEGQRHFKIENGSIVERAERNRQL